MKISIITPWNTVCGVSEFAYFLVSALEARGHMSTIFANFFAGEYYKIPTSVRDDGDNVYRVFATGFDKEVNRLEFNGHLFEKLSRESDILVINYQDYVFPNKAALNACIKLFQNAGKKVYILVHDSAISPELGSFGFDSSYWIVPPSLTSFPRQNVIYIDQGIPEFPNLNNISNVFDRVKNKTWALSCFGMGRNKTHDLIALVKKINEENVLSKPVSLSINIAKPNQFDEYKDIEKDPLFTIIKGYRKPEALAWDLNVSDACVIWYPDIGGQSTSSAFRFAVGSKVPIISNLSNWNRDQINFKTWIAVTDHASTFKNAILALFRDETYYYTRAQITHYQDERVFCAGWSKIAERYDSLFNAR